MTRLLLLACFVLACQQRSAVQNPPPPPSPPPPPPPPPGGVDTIPIAGHALYVPAGFTVNLFAQQIPGPRNLALGPDGAVYVALQGSGQIARLVDGDGDGVAESVVSVLTGLDQPHRLRWCRTSRAAGDTSPEPWRSAPTTVCTCPSGLRATCVTTPTPDSRP